MGTAGIATSGTLLRVTDVNGLVGYGFIIEHGGLDHLSVAWPDKPAERFTEEMVGRYEFVIEEAFPALLEYPCPSTGEAQEPEMQDAQGIATDKLASPISGDAGSTIQDVAPIPGFHFLSRAGVNTIEDVKKYIAEHGSLIPIKGIGEKLNAEILEFLKSTEETSG